MRKVSEYTVSYFYMYGKLSRCGENPCIEFLCSRVPIYVFFN